MHRNPTGNYHTHPNFLSWPYFTAWLSYFLLHLYFILSGKFLNLVFLVLFSSSCVEPRSLILRLFLVRPDCSHVFLILLLQFFSALIRHPHPLKRRQGQSL